MTREELAAKADWEGGLAEAIFGYGLKSSDLPADAPQRIRACWERLETVAKGDLDELGEWLFKDLETGI